MIEMPGRFARGTKARMRGSVGREGRMSRGLRGGGEAREDEKRHKMRNRIIQSFQVFAVFQLQH